VLRAGSIGDLFDMAVAFARQTVTQQSILLSPRGGPGIIPPMPWKDSGLKLPSLSQSTQETLLKAPPASVLNPIDVLGDARSGPL
jgi:acyl-CoA synthetase (NDP forming)